MRNRAGMTPLIVQEIVRETPTIVSVVLADPEGRRLPPWDPGAHIDLQLITRHERQYSLCGDPADEFRYRIAVLREEHSRGASHYIHNFLKVGRKVFIRPPRNLFPLSDAKRHLLLAAGIGITPLLSMARRLAAGDADWTLVYAVRTREDVAFAPELEALGDHVRIHVSAESGRLDLAGLLAGLEPGTDVSACGPRGFTDTLTSLAETLPEGCRLHLERFEPKPRSYLPNTAFTVECARSERTVEVPAGQTMLQAMQAARVGVAGSCMRGVCGSCAVQVVDGTPEHRDSLTTDDASMIMYPCVSRSLTPTLVIDA
ncbi:oxidoreductase [Plantibacter sp. MCCC 1A11337]|uniref:PDR/VanB family oxidoreductase n=1 Tax=Plantibacter sp. MCCC 1A11337 TaxID=2736644 RepID=UPI0015839FFE|nr:PDR/VanB family oxidoreductase [Plantibacter sp. MCCC 1A11337]NUJ88536.1 oxidoreductase [Plantibacter sp. MCCC 1A11337]